MIRRLIILLLIVGCDILQEEDCAGVAGGDAVYDECYVCDGNNLPNTGICDCNATPNGTAVEDLYGGCCSSIPTDFCDCNSEYVSLWGECYSIENTLELDLYSNQLTGEIPSEIGNLTNLRYLRLYDNQLTGEIPSEIGNLTNLIELDLGINQLTGEIPSEFGNLTNLTFLNLYANELTGEIPSELGNLTNLTQLGLSYNQLSGEIPQQVCDLIENNNIPSYMYLNGNNLINTCD